VAQLRRSSCLRATKLISWILGSQHEYRLGVALAQLVICFYILEADLAVEVAVMVRESDLVATHPKEVLDLRLRTLS